MNYSTMAFLSSDEVIAVKCIFEDANFKAYREDEVSPSKVRLYKPKEYTYKSLDKNLKEGDLVLVECEGASNHFGYCVVKVVEVDTEIDFDNSIKYKWIVGKLDQAQIDNILKTEQELIKKVKKMEKANKAKQVREALGLERLTNLISFTKP